MFFLKLKKPFCAYFQQCRSFSLQIMLTEEFELSSVKNNSGGLLDKGIPNYVYRWSEREVFKLLNSFNPEKVHNIKFNYENDLTNIKSKKKDFLYST